MSRWDMSRTKPWSRERARDGFLFTVTVTSHDVTLTWSWLFAFVTDGAHGTEGNKRNRFLPASAACSMCAVLFDTTALILMPLFYGFIQREFTLTIKLFTWTCSFSLCGMAQFTLQCCVHEVEVERLGGWARLLSCSALQCCLPTVRRRSPAQVGTRPHCFNCFSSSVWGRGGGLAHVCMNLFVVTVLISRNK